MGMKSGRQKGSRTKRRWREYLKGHCLIEDSRIESEMRFYIRERAIRIMQDLLLICQKMPHRDRTLIFHNVRRELKDNTFEKTIKPLFFELQNNLATFTRDSEDFEQIVSLTRALIAVGMKFDMIRLADDKQYRDCKIIQLRSRTGAIQRE